MELLHAEFACTDTFPPQSTLAISNFHFTAQRMVNVIISRLWTKPQHATLKRLQEGRRVLNRNLSSQLNLWTVFIVLVYLPKSITALYGEQLRRHASDLPLTLINAIQLLFIPVNEFLLGKTAQTPNIPYLLVRHIPFTLESDTFSRLLSTDLHISLRNEPKNKGRIFTPYRKLESRHTI
jgi:hypothetical protein